MKFLVILIALCVSVEYAHSTISDYGGPCTASYQSNSYRCKPTQSCLNGKCGCVPGSTYFPTLEHCGIKVGDTCPISGSWCIQGATCVSGKCACSDVSDVLANGGCAGVYYQRCSSEQPCSSSKFFDCQNGICQCSNGTFNEFDRAATNYESCRATGAGGACSSDGISAPKCGNNAVCNNGQCACLAGFSLTSRGECVKGYQAQCSRNEECNQEVHLRCNHGVCDCGGVGPWYPRYHRCCDPTAMESTGCPAAI